jgi:NIMA (never in mitosis gene a)-related kinase
MKSANVFLTKSGQVKLGDLNVSKLAQNGLLSTQTGTPYYASPEVWKDKPYGEKSDIWSLGCVVYEMTTLRPPFNGKDMEMLYRKVCKGQYNPISAHFSKELSSLISKLM